MPFSTSIKRQTVHSPLLRILLLPLTTSIPRICPSADPHLSAHGAAAVVAPNLEMRPWLHILQRQSCLSAPLRSIFERMVSSLYVLLLTSQCFLNSLKRACKATTHKQLLIKAINTSLIIFPYSVIFPYSRLLPTLSFLKYFLLLASVRPHFSWVSSYSPLCLLPGPYNSPSRKHLESPLRYSIRACHSLKIPGHPYTPCFSLG